MFYTRNAHQFIRESYEDLLKLSRKRLDLLDEDSIHAYLHEFVLYVHKSNLLNKYDPARGGSFNTFITKSLFNFYSCRTKKFKRDSEKISTNEKILSAASDKSMEASQALNNYSLSSFLDKLDPWEAEVVEMLLDGFNFDDIGSRFGKSRSLVGWHVHKIRKKLKKFKFELFF